MGLRTRALSLVLAFSMMLSILPLPRAFAADNASSTPIEMSDVMSLGHDGDNAKYGYPIGSGMDHKMNASGTGWRYDGSTETLYLEAGYTFVNHSTLNYYTSCKVVNDANVDGWNLWYGDVVNNGTITNSRIHPDLTTNNATGVISTCRIGERAYNYAVENNGKIDHCDFIGDGTVAGDRFHESSTANTVTLTGSGTIDHCVFKSKTDYPASNIITNSAFLNNKQDFFQMHTIKMTDGETNTKLFAILYNCNSGYGVSGLDTIGFVGSPSLYVAGEASYGGSRTLASVNGKAIGADDIPGVTTAQTQDPPASVLHATSNGFALTPNGTSDITLSQVVAPAPNPSPDGKLYLDENGVPVHTSGDGWSYEPKVLYDYQGTRLALVIKRNASITLAGNQLVSVPVYLEDGAALEGGIYTDEVYLNYTSTLKNATLFGGIGGQKTTKNDMVRFSYPDGAVFKFTYPDDSIADNIKGNGGVRLPIGTKVEMTVPVSAEEGFAGWVPMKLVPVSDYRGVYQRMNAIPGQESVSLTDETLKFEVTEQLNELAFWVDHTITVINNGVTVSNADGKAITAAAQWEKVYLTAAEGDLENIAITGKDGSINIENDTDGNYYFTMPDSAVTIRLSSSTDPSEPSGPSEPAGPGGESDGAGVAGAVVAVTAIGAVSYAVVTRVWLESILPEGSSIPTSRQQLADLLWIAAGRPEPVSKVLYPDISAAEVDHQKAALWCVEQGLLKDNGEVFRPNDHTFRPQVIKAWNQLQDALNAAQ